MAEVGTVVVDRYRLAAPIARGGMGTVWRAHDERLQRDVALKLLHAAPGLDPREAEVASARAVREARITARLHHPHAVTVFDVVEYEGRPCLVMQYVPSRSLQAVLDDLGALHPAAVARIGAEVASALAAAHRAGIIHRDVKPANVLITEDGSAKLTDFGISHALGDASLTSTGMVTGTPAYLAPEVARGASAGFASDVYALGATLYRAVEGAPPFGPGANAMAVLHRVATGRYEPPSPTGPLSPLLERMLTTASASRPPAHNVARELQALAGDLAAGGPDRVPGVRGDAAGGPEQLRSPVTAPMSARPAAPPPARPAAPAPAPPPRPAPTRSGPPTSVSPAEPARPQRRRGPWIAAAVLLVAVLVVGIALATRPGSPADRATGPASTATTPTASGSATGAVTGSRAAATPPTGTGSAPTTGAPTAAELVGAVTSYYALLPADTDAGWARLTASYQADPSGGRAGYDEFWGGITAVSVSDVTATVPGTVVATVEYTFTDGSSSVERTSYGLVRDGGLLKIDSSEVLGKG